MTVSRTPYRGMTLVARFPVPTGIPGMPGAPCSATSVPGIVVNPLTDNAEAEPDEGAAQDGGTDNWPMEPARLMLTVTALVAPPTALRSAEENIAPSPRAPGVTSAGFSEAAPSRPRLFSAPMIPAQNDSTSWVTPTVAYIAKMPSRMLKSSGRMFGQLLNDGSASGTSEVNCDHTDWALAGALPAAWLTATLWAANPAGLVSCPGAENGTNAVAMAEVAA
ncbi:hypothetical protein YM3MPS_42780 [Mycobacterium pseudoshottsii]|nr:hypothetical protein DL240490_00242 [Mycobacterium marinum]BEH78475.1 hypothetical protein YM3MPS_42780 [Mycobacterium pseudoshottsii]